MQKKLIKLVQHYPWSFLVSIISAEIGAIFLIVQYRQVASFANSIMVRGASFEPVMVVLIGIVAAVLLRGFFQFLSDLTARRLAVQIKSKIRHELLQKAARLQFQGQTDKNDFHALMIDGVETLDLYFSQYVPQIFISVFIPLTILLFVFPLDRLTGLVLLLTAPLIPIFMVLIGRHAKAVTSQQWLTLKRMSSFFLDSIRGVKTLLLFNQGEKQVKRLETVSTAYHDVTMKVLRVAFLSAFALEFISTLSTAVVAVEIGLRLLYGRLGFEEAFFILLIAPEFYLPLRNLGLRFHAGMNGVAAANSIFSFLALPENQPNQAQPLKNFSWDSYQAIRFNTLSAAYRTPTQPALNAVNFEVPLGKKTAIIGPSGAGKSTVFQILLRFMQPVEGFVSLDNLAIEAIDLEAWRTTIGWIPQKPYLYNGTLLENLKIGNPYVTSHQIQAVLKQTSLSDFVNHLPYRLETKLSDLGTGVSAGQRQRLAIARLLLRDCQLLLFDELSTSLDSVGEEQVLESFDHFLPGRTWVSIAHRLHTILSSDHIILLNEGLVSAVGNHHSLLAESELYARFLNAYFGVTL